VRFVKLRSLAFAAAAVATVVAVTWLTKLTPRDGTGSSPDVHSTLPAESTAKTILNTTRRHREWVNLRLGPAIIRAFLVYPQRSGKAPVVIVTGADQGASDWVRAAADQLAAEGFLAAVPDVLSGLGPHGGDTESFPDAGAVASAIRRMSPDEIARRIAVVRDYAITLPAANERSATLELSPGDGQIQAHSEKHFASFKLNGESWPQAISFLSKQTGNRMVASQQGDQTPPPAMEGMSAEDHSAHIMMAMAQQPPGAQQTGGGPRGYPMGKLPDLPAGVFSAKSTLLHSTLRKEFVDLPVGDVKLHIWVEYPAGSGNAPVVIVMQHGPGMDDWQRALADQLALQGFIAVAADLYSGLGPNGGNWDSFEGVDAALRASAKLSPEEAIRRYKVAYEYGMKLPRASGKVASLGFCAGGTYSFRFAGEAPEINAAVVFYGTQPSSDIIVKIKAPVLGFYGEDDARVTGTVEPTISAMKQQGKSYEPHIYPHATHGFLEFQDLAGNPAATADSWARTIAFLNERLK
jgi:carboxymethylenebutenolidase